MQTATKVLTIVLLFLLLTFLTSSTPANAQQWSNKFSCEWDGLSCNVKPPSADQGCGPGFDAVASVCESKTDLNSCQSTVEQECVQVLPPGSKFSCQPSFGGCMPDEFGPYSNINSCQAACAGTQDKKFTCHATLGCIEDPNGSLSISQCESNCRPPQPLPAVCEINLNLRGIKSAIGCIPISNEEELIVFIVKWSIGAGGGLAFLLIIYGAFLILTSGGDAEKVQSGKQTITAAIAGIVLIIFSAFVLRLVAVEILKIPGFGN